MRFVAYLCLALCIPASMIRAQEQPKFSPAQQEVLDAHKARIAASERHDFATWSRYVADDCIFSDDDGVLHTKANSLEQWGKVPPEYDYDVNPGDFLVHVYGSTAVINLQVTIHEQFADADIVTGQRTTETYVKQNGSWLLIAKQWSNLPVNFRKPVAVDASVYKDYVGEYEWRPGNVETVVVKDGKLWSQMGDMAEYLPSGVDTFFLKEGDLATFEFSRDARGHVIGYTYRRIDGQEIHVKKIK